MNILISRFEDVERYRAWVDTRSFENIEEAVCQFVLNFEHSDLVDVDYAPALPSDTNDVFGYWFVGLCDGREIVLRVEVL